MKDRRDPGRFRECLSVIMVTTAALGGFLVLLDPEFIIGPEGWSFKIGSDGFSKELKGAVVTIMLIGGWQAVQGYWLGASAGGQKQSESMSRIAEASAATPATPIKTDDVKIDATGANIDIAGAESGRK